MKRITCFVLALALTLCAVPIYADSGSVPVKSNKNR